MKRIVCCVMFAVGVIWAALPAPAQQPYVPDAPGFEDLDFSPGFQQQRPSTFTFLNVSPTARVAGMGDAYTAVAEGMDAIYWNPAGIAAIRKVGYSFGYTQWFADCTFYSGAVAYNVGWASVVGISVVSFQPMEMEETTTLQPDGTGKMLDTGDIAIGFVYARQLTDKLSVGGTVRYVQSTLATEKLKTVAMNVGTLLHTGFKSFRIGMSMKNFGNEQRIVSENSEMPTVFNVGGSMEVYGELGDPVSLTGAFEGAYFTDRCQRWNLGGELWLRNLLALRAGYKFQYDAESWSVGAGLKGAFSGHTFHVDVSYTDFGDLLEAPLRLTFSGSF